VHSKRAGKMKSITQASDGLLPLITFGSLLEAAAHQHDDGVHINDGFADFVEQTRKSLEDVDARILLLQGKGSAEGSIIDAEKGSVFKVMADVNTYLNENVQYLTQEEHDVHEKHFRDRLTTFSAGAALLFRGLSRPLGYAGDYETMRMCYDNSYEGTTLLGKIMHKYTTEFTRSQAVRNRRGLIAGFAEGKRNIMSVACGPAAEVGFMAAQNPDTMVSVTLLDQDKEALDFARAQLANVDLNHVKVTYINMSVYTIIKDASVDLGRFDMIYSMGLFDYLNDSAAKKLCAKLLGMLAPDGELIIGNFHVRCPNRYLIQYWCDWPLYYRTEVAMYQMVPAGGQQYASCIVYEQTKTQMFLKVRRVSSKL